MKLAIIIMAAILAAVCAVAAWRGGGALVWRGFLAGGKTLWANLALVVMAFLVAGFVQVMVPKEFIVKWLGAGAGFKGVMIGSLAGALLPGGPYISFPIVASLYQQGASLGTVVAFYASWSLWSLPRLPLEVGLLGPKLAIARFVTTFVVPPLAGLAAQALFARWT